MIEDHVGAGISYAVTELRIQHLNRPNSVNVIINLYCDEIYLLRIMEQMSGFQDSFQKGSQTGAQENWLLTHDSK